MELNLPSILTQSKASTLFLLPLFHYFSKTEAGTQFASCTSLYGTIVANFGKVPDKETFCCDKSAGTYSWQCLAQSYVCSYPSFGQCNRIGQSMFCIVQGTGSLNPGGLCGGILGDTNSTDDVTGMCPSLSVVGNTLGSQSTNSVFSWLCCDNSNCFVPPNVAITGSTVDTNCTNGWYNMMCFWDNNGWTCSGSVGANISDITHPIGDCVLQISNNSISTNTFGNTPISSSKITHVIIPTTVGTAVGVGSVGGLTYYLYKAGYLKSLLKIIKPKIKIQKQEGKNVNVEIELLGVGNEEETVDQSEQKDHPLPIPPVKAHLTNLSNRTNSSLVSQSSFSYHQLIDQIRSRLDPEGQELLNNFLDVQDIFYNSNERTRDIAERQLQRAKENLRIKITKIEMELLEKSYWQKESDYQTQIEVSNSSQVRLVG